MEHKRLNRDIRSKINKEKKAEIYKKIIKRDSSNISFNDIGSHHFYTKLTYLQKV